MLIARCACWYEGGATGLLQHTFLRPSGLLIGCLLALAPKVEGPRFAVPAMLTAILALAIFGREGSGAMLLFGPLAASILTAGVIACLQRSGRAVAVLSCRPLRYAGKISYGLYLYSVPIFILAKSHFPHMPSAVMVPIIFIAAALSYEFVERPCLRLKDRLGTQSTRQLAVAAT
jgi:peptidoglycan/LPS O-acetylase OafA/YrhL